MHKNTDMMGKFPNTKQNLLVTGEQVEQTGFAGPGGPHDGRQFSTPYRSAYALQDRFPAWNSANSHATEQQTKHHSVMTDTKQNIKKFVRIVK